MFFNVSNFKTTLFVRKLGLMMKYVILFNVLTDKISL